MGYRIDSPSPIFRGILSEMTIRSSFLAGRADPPPGPSCGDPHVLGLRRSLSVQMAPRSSRANACIVSATGAGVPR